MIKLSLPTFENQPVIKRNFFVNVFDGGIFSFAMSFVSLVTVVPVFIKKIGGSNLAIGLIPVIWTASFNFPQVFIANHARKFPYKKKFVLKTGLMQRLPWLFLALISFFVIEKIPNEIGLALLFIGLAVAATGGSLNLPGWFDLVSKITPVQLRGRLFAFRSILGALLGVIGGILVSYILDNIKYPDSFGFLFLLAFLIMMISYCFVAMIKEQEPNHQKQLFKYKDFFKHLFVILKKEKNYRNFLVADALMNIAIMADAFYTVNALDKFSLPDGYAGIFTIVIMTSMILGNIFFGNLADYLGHKVNLLLAALFRFIICVMALISPFVSIYFIVFVGSAFITSLLQVSRLTMIAEICGEEDRPTYVSLTNMITAPFVLSGILGGWLANHFGYNIVFIIAGIVSLIAAFWFFNMVEEPRRRSVAVKV